ncbi:charged multivesicular body protein 7-like [Tubulanus polymorphus]|uniref:charged multivesicular body protein 7-like n=1 Tax=Tubulanus polymorphus TaxID=672921 RepID=UPI003DA574F9
MAEDNRSHFPDQWKDDPKMDNYFAPFRNNRDVNLNSWNSKMNFWKKLILSDLEHTNTAIVDAKSVANNFKRNGRTPKCLAKVVHELVSEGKLKKKEDIEKELNSSWMSWGVDVFVRKPFSWTLKTVVGSSDKDCITEGQYVLSELIQEMSSKILDFYQRTMQVDVLDHLVDYSVLMSRCKHICSDETSFNLSLLTLQKNGKVHIAEEKGYDKIVKFCKKDEEKVILITETDKKTIKLKRTEQALQHEIEKLYQDVENRLTEAKSFVKKGQKSSARTSLRGKKNLCLLIDKRETALLNIQDMLQKIRNSESDKKILESYEIGTDILKTSRGDVSISKIDDTMCNLEEAIEEQGEIGAALSKGFVTTDGDGDISISELEAELELLEFDGDLDDKLTGNPVKDSIFPQVPTFTPGSPDQLNSTYDVDDLEKALQKESLPALPAL